jgi:tRNA splicing endonuclease
MNRTIIILACMLAAPLAFAQPGAKQKKQTTTEAVTVTGSIIKMTAQEGAAASYQPLRTLVVREENSQSPDRYVLNGYGHVLDKTGKVVQTAIKPGARVRVYYAHAGDSHGVDHVVLLD